MDLRTLRQERGVSVFQVAKELGISRNRYIVIEKGGIMNTDEQSRIVEMFPGVEFPPPYTLDGVGLRALRRAANITLKELSKKLGCTLNELWETDNGVRPSKATEEKLRKFFKPDAAPTYTLDQLAQSVNVLSLVHHAGTWTLWVQPLEGDSRRFTGRSIAEVLGEVRL